MSASQLQNKTTENSSSYSITAKVSHTVLRNGEVQVELALVDSQTTIIHLTHSQIKELKLQPQHSFPFCYSI